ncbi:MAG: PilN domain-containing protein, partial [Candidatus Omnitrophica bacterium]|nr:PilN domain-containing protein [Candidatus Omnitrophota bacterium]
SMKPTAVYTNGTTYSFIQPGEASAAQGEGLSPGQIKEFIRKNRINPRYLVLGIPRSQVSVRYLNLPTLKEEELKRMVDYEVTGLFPCKPQELIYDHVLIDKASDGYSRIMLVAARKSFLNGVCETLKNAGLIPDAVSVSTFSLYHQFIRRHRPDAAYLVVYHDTRHLELMLIENKKPVFSRAFPLGEKETPESICRKIKETVIILQTKGFRIDMIVARVPGAGRLEQMLREETGREVETDDTLDPAEGLLGARRDFRHAVNLVPVEFKHTKRVKKSKRAFLYFGLLLFVNLTFAVNIVMVRKKVRSEYLGWLESEIARIEKPASRIQQRIEDMRLLQHSLTSGRLSLALLAEVYRLAPEEMSLTLLEITHEETGGRITLKGSAQSSQETLAFAQELKQSAFITAAEVSYIRKNARVSGKRAVSFEVRAQF